jgi:hypothetical protein
VSTESAGSGGPALSRRQFRQPRLYSARSAPLIRQQRRCSGTVLVAPEEQVPERAPHPISEPALRHVPGAVVLKVARLTPGAEIPLPASAGIMMDVCRGQNHAPRALPGHVLQIRPARWSPSSIPPSPEARIEPAPVSQDAQLYTMRTAAPLALARGALEADTAAQLSPVLGIQGTEFGANRHRIGPSITESQSSGIAIYGPLALVQSRPLIPAMPRKPEVPSIPEAPAQQSKPAPRSRAGKAKPEKEPEPPAMPDLWGAFGDVWVFGEPVEPAESAPAKPRPRKGSGKR